MRSERPPVRIWTVYENPLDYPGKLVARLWEVRAGERRATGSMVVVSPDRYDVLEEMFLTMGLTRIDRAESDDAQIRESWL